MPTGLISKGDSYQESSFSVLSKDEKRILNLRKAIDDNLDILKSQRDDFTLDITELLKSMEFDTLSDWLYDNDIVYKILPSAMDYTGFEEVDSIFEDIVCNRDILRFKNKEDVVSTKLRWLGEEFKG